jgi:hypothetical protein
MLDRSDASSGGIFQPSIVRFMQNSSDTTWHFYNQHKSTYSEHTVE